MHKEWKFAPTAWIKRIYISVGPWVTPMWLNTWYGPQIQLGWIVIAITTSFAEFED